jgi:hypothetical protein
MVTKRNFMLRLDEAHGGELGIETNIVSGRSILRHSPTTLSCSTVAALAGS